MLCNCCAIAVQLTCLIRMILGLNTEKRRFLRDVQDVQKFALIRTGVNHTTHDYHLKITTFPDNGSGIIDCHDDDDNEFIVGSIDFVIGC
jgi:hypothetical protein